MPTLEPTPTTDITRDTAVVFLTHQWREAAAHRFARLRREVTGHADCFLLLQDDGGSIRARWEAFLDSVGALAALRLFDRDKLPVQLGYPFYRDRAIMASAHFPLMCFSRAARYRYYWQIEYDVELRGDWGALLSAASGNDAALLASHIHRHADWPSWQWWKSLAAPAGVALSARDLRKAFFPVFRISRPAVDAVEQAYRAGWKGHFEVVIPTVLLRQALRMQDLRAVQPCYIGESQNPCPLLPLQSTMRWRPEVTRGEFSARGTGALLFHPVKGNWCYDGAQLREWPQP